MHAFKSIAIPQRCPRYLCLDHIEGSFVGASFPEEGSLRKEARVVS